MALRIVDQHVEFSGQGRHVLLLQGQGTQVTRRCQGKRQSQRMGAISSGIERRAMHGRSQICLFVGRGQSGGNERCAQGRQGRFAHAAQLQIAEARQLDLARGMGSCELGQYQPLSGG